ncbi:MAG: hypothetical protein FK731_14935 [Asgard group archaeon]|nr:hypothetical protein [Asgard group archaeon]
MAVTPESQAALDILRVWPDEFKWYLIPLFAIVVYMYAVEIEKKNWNRIFAGLAFWGMDWFNEIWNALVLFFTQESAVWTCAGETGLLILVGLNIEITMMFAIAGIAFSKMLPEDKSWKIPIINIPNRWFFIIGNSIFCVFVEIILNQANALLWHYPFWNATLFGWIPIVIFGYMPFMIVSFRVYDMKTRKNQLLTLGVIYFVDIIALVLFAGVLGWI